MKLDIDDNETQTIIQALEVAGETFLIKRIKLALKLDKGSRKRRPSSAARESTMDFRRNTYSKEKVFQS